MQHRVNCRWCKFSFQVMAASCDDWRVEVQCPCCETWACFTAADTRDPPRPDPAALAAEAQQIGEWLWQPINEHRDHPAVKWMDRVGNGLFEDDYTGIGWPVPHVVYRFIRGAFAAYVWQEGGSWFVRTWCPLRGCNLPPDPTEVFSFERALDRLVSEAEPGATADRGNG